MVSPASFSSLDHAITIARDIWFNKLDLSCWIEALSSRDYLNQCLTDATESTVQELLQWGSKYEEKFGYGLVTDAHNKTLGEILTELMSRFENSQLVEFDIVHREEINIIETKITGSYVLWHQNMGSLEDTINGVKTYTRDNSRENTYLGIDIARQFDRTHSRERRKAPMDGRHNQDSKNVSHRTFDLNKEPMFEDDMSEHLKRDHEKFLALYFLSGKIDT
ncbi:hypothetical protein PIB30_046838 [Stylosanthes scabra]|uniref:2-oxo-4-hydroxy-4-carboxy-5-ureidoimidazoline decarboxylase n=1 Tax=Stylosanthes scabra TaxID=79078 RepID=A0ABU6WIJ1_9FABA|nr:hypothetical protein [Stylosanthes scabra]